METPSSVTPILSVIVPGLLGADSVAAVLPFWTEQADAEQMEVIVFCPDAETLPPHPDPRVRYLACDGLLLHQARSKAVLAARGSYILLAEDHCVPHPGAVTSLLRCIDDGWDLVGPVMEAGTMHTVAARAAFLLGYCQWMEPRERGPVRVLAGHNVMIRADCFPTTTDALEEELFMATFFVQKLCRTRRAFLETDWRQSHYDPPEFRRELKIFWTIGIAFGAKRTRRWPQALRLLFPFLLPVAVGRHWARGLIGYVRAGRRAGMGLDTLGVLSLYAIATGTGEVLGAISGRDRVAKDVWICEIKPLTEQAIALG